jgi:hypothetical protein
MYLVALMKITPTQHTPLPSLCASWSGGSILTHSFLLGWQLVTAGSPTGSLLHALWGFCPSRLLQDQVCLAQASEQMVLGGDGCLSCCSTPRGHRSVRVLKGTVGRSHFTDFYLCPTLTAPWGPGRPQEPLERLPSAAFPSVDTFRVSGAQSRCQSWRASSSDVVEMGLSHSRCVWGHHQPLVGLVRNF